MRIPGLFVGIPLLATLAIGGANVYSCAKNKKPHSQPDSSNTGILKKVPDANKGMSCSELIKRMEVEFPEVKNFTERALKSCY